jgi:CDP-paratose 2-epimerase
VSDTRAFQTATCWSPEFSVSEGVTALMEWLCESRGIKLQQAVSSKTVPV